MPPDDTVLVAADNSAAEIGRGEPKRTMKNFLLKLKVMKDTRGQDLIEYALMAGFVAVAAGAIMPGVATSISTIFSKIGCVMSTAATQGS